MRSTVEGIPFSPRMAQNGRLLRRNSRLGGTGNAQPVPISAREGRRRHARRKAVAEYRLQVAVEEIENVVFGRIDSRCKCGPCHRRQRGKRGAQPPVPAGGKELGEIRQLALGHELFGQARIQTVQTEEDDFLDRACRNARPRQSARQATRSGHVRNENAPRRAPVTSDRNDPRNAKPAPGPT